jgi:hypothetical protein
MDQKFDTCKSEKVVVRSRGDKPVRGVNTPPSLPSLKNNNYDVTFVNKHRMSDVKEETPRLDELN